MYKEWSEIVPDWPSKGHCHENFGLLKILGLNFSKILVHLWRIGSPLIVYYSGAVKHDAMSNVATQVLSNFVHLFNCCTKNGYINVVAIHGSIIPEADNHIRL